MAGEGPLSITATGSTRAVATCEAGVRGEEVVGRAAFARIGIVGGAATGGIGAVVGAISTCTVGDEAGSDGLASVALDDVDGFVSMREATAGSTSRGLGDAVGDGEASLVGTSLGPGGVGGAETLMGGGVPTATWFWALSSACGGVAEASFADLVAAVGGPSVGEVEMDEPALPCGTAVRSRAVVGSSCSADAAAGRAALRAKLSPAAASAESASGTSSSWLPGVVPVVADSVVDGAGDGPHGFVLEEREAVGERPGDGEGVAAS